MNQTEQVISAMERLGGVSTLGRLYQTVDSSGWSTQTPFATIRRIVQNQRYFFKIKAGLWALNTHRDRLDHLINPGATAKKREELDHYYYQGLLLEIGNVKRHQTFVPSQDKNRAFLDTTLGEVRRLKEMHRFSYERIVRRARTIDVIWFNRRNMPEAVFEVEHTTNFRGALSKYIELQDFNVQFYIVANHNRHGQYMNTISSDEYHPIKGRVKFLDYEQLAGWHSNIMQSVAFAELP